MYDDLRPSGYLYTNFRIAHEGKTETNPGHATILSGTWQQVANDGSQHPTEPTLFEYFRKELSSGLTDNYIVGGKAKLSILSYSIEAEYGADYRASAICSDIPDNTVFNNCISVMETYHPRLILINLADTDRQGHSGVWSNYLNALANADNIVYQLWQHIQSGDYDYTMSNTTLFVTNDHGRHDDAHGGFTDHGDDCDGCEHIMLFAIGRNVSPGVENTDLHYQTDIAPTVGDLLNFNTPQAIGTSLYKGGNPLPVGISIPLKFELFQNYPNPFNPITTIKYQISELSFVSLKVYDILSNEIATLVNGEKSAGNYEVEFDAGSISSGVYFYKLRTESFVETKKMVLMK
ncbi:MAG: T9SS type A sorting domain-containing protein [Ignavibacteria bacterium]